MHGWPSSSAESPSPRSARLTPKTARILLPDGSSKILPAESVQIGDRLLVKPGETIAVDAADIVLVYDELKELPHILALSKRMMKVIQVNLAFSMVLNFVAVFVIIHSALLLKWKKE